MCIHGQGLSPGEEVCRVPDAPSCAEGFVQRTVVETFEAHVRIVGTLDGSLGVREAAGLALGLDQDRDLVVGSLCQRSQEEIREVLSRMERDLGYLDRGGSGRGTYWTLRADTHARLAAPGDADRDRRTDWEAAKTRVLSVIRQRAARGEPPMTNADVRRITALDRKQVNRLIHELEQDGQVRMKGHGRGARYLCAQAGEEEK